MKLLLFISGAHCLSGCISQEVNPDIPSTEYLLDPSFEDHDCTAVELQTAGTIATEGQWKGQIIGYPGGQCGFVKTQNGCEPNSIFNFLELYYCTIKDKFCDSKFWVMLPLVVSKTNLSFIV